MLAFRWALALHLLVLGIAVWSDDFSGYVMYEARYFPHDPLWSDQSDETDQSVAIRPEFSYVSESGGTRFSLISYYRFDDVDDRRSRGDLQEAYVQWSSGNWNWLVGVNKVFWGVAESRHLVDIINQTNLAEDIDGEQKLGQPMIALERYLEAGSVSLYLLPYFRERAFPGESGRLRLPLSIDDDRTHYESSSKEQHLDVALRYKGSFDGWDLGVHYFRGTDREPIFMLDTTDFHLLPYYQQIQQIGIDAQYTREAWLWKLESIYRYSDIDAFASAVAGFEYTIYQIFDSAMDTGVLCEAIVDNRNDKSPQGVADHALFAGIRHTFNDAADSSILAGAIVDTNDRGRIYSIEMRTRVFTDYQLDFNIRQFVGREKLDFLTGIAQDDYVEMKLYRYF